MAAPRRHFTASCSGLGLLLVALAAHASKAAATTSVQFTPDYKKLVSPPNAKVMIGVKFTKMHEVNVLASTIRISCWFRRFWYDERLSLPEGTPANVTGFVSPEDIWTPDLTFWQQVDDFQEFCSIVDATVFSSAYVNENNTSMKYNVFLSEACTFTVKCRLYMRDFPFDVNSCPLDIGPWMDDSYTLTPQHDTTSSDLINQQFSVQFWADHTPQDFGWTLPSGEVVSLPSIRFHIVIDRFARYYGVNYICPLLVMVCLSWFSFFIPLDKSDRIAYAVTLLLTCMAVQFITAERRPAEKDDGWIDLFCTTSLLLISVPILQTTFLFRVQRWVEIACEEDHPTMPEEEVMQKVFKAVTPLDRMSRVFFPIVVILWICSLVLCPWSPVTESRTEMGHEDMEYARERSWIGTFTLMVFVFFWAPLALSVMVFAVWNWLRLGPTRLSHVRDAFMFGACEPQLRLITQATTDTSELESE